MKILTMNLEFSILRIIEDNTSVNTGIISNYRIISVNENKFPELLNNITKDYNSIIKKYTEKYPFQIEI